MRLFAFASIAVALAEELCLLQQQSFRGTLRDPSSAGPWSGELLAQTADADGAATRSRVHAVFVVDGEEHQVDFFHGSAKFGLESRSLQFTTRPTQLRLKLNENDAWGYWKLALRETSASGFTECVLLDHPNGAQAEPAGENQYWLDFKDGASVEHAYEIPAALECGRPCSAPRAKDGEVCAELWDADDFKQFPSGWSEEACYIATSWDRDCTGLTQYGGNDDHCLCQRHGGRCTLAAHANEYTSIWKSLRDGCQPSLECDMEPIQPGNSYCAFTGKSDHYAIRYWDDPDQKVKVAVPCNPLDGAACCAELAVAEVDCCGARTALADLGKWACLRADEGSKQRQHTHVMSSLDTLDILKCQFRNFDFSCPPTVDDLPKLAMPPPPSASGHCGEFEPRKACAGHEDCLPGSGKKCATEMTLLDADTKEDCLARCSGMFQDGCCYFFAGGRVEGGRRTCKFYKDTLIEGDKGKERYATYCGNAPSPAPTPPPTTPAPTPRPRWSYDDCMKQAKVWKQGAARRGDFKRGCEFLKQGVPEDECKKKCAEAYGGRSLTCCECSGRCHTCPCAYCDLFCKSDPRVNTLA